MSRLRRPPWPKAASSSGPAGRPVEEPRQDQVEHRGLGEHPAGRHPDDRRGAERRQPEEAAGVRRHPTAAEPGPEALQRGEDGVQRVEGVGAGGDHHPSAPADTAASRARASARGAPRGPRSPAARAPRAEPPRPSRAGPPRSAPRARGSQAGRRHRGHPPSGRNPVDRDQAAGPAPARVLRLADDRLGGSPAGSPSPSRPSRRRRPPGRRRGCRPR